MASSDLIKQFLPSMAGNATSYVIGRMHGRAGDMPKYWKNDAGEGRIPLDAALGTVGYLAAAFGKKYVGDTVARIAQGVGDAGFYYFTGQLGAKAGQDARIDAGEMSAEGQAWKAAHPNSKAVVTGQSAIAEMIARMKQSQQQEEMAKVAVEAAQSK